MKEPKKEKTESKEKAKRRLPSAARVAFFGGTGALVLLVGGTAAYAFYVKDRILPHTKVAGVSVGGLTRQEALEKVGSHIGAFESSKLTLAYQGKQWDVPASDLQLSFDAESSVAAAYGGGKTGGAYRQTKDFFASFVRTRSYGIDLAPIGDAGRAALDKQVLGSIETPTAETTLSFAPGKVEVVPGTPGNRLDYNDFEAKVAAALSRGTSPIALHLIAFQPTVDPALAVSAKQQAEAILAGPWTATAGSYSATYEPSQVAKWLATEPSQAPSGAINGLSLVFKEDVVKAALDEFAAKAAVKPVNAVLKGENNAVTVSKADVPGQSVEAATALASFKSTLLAAASTRTVQVPVVAVQADLRADTLGALGIKELIGTATTDFTGSPANRKFNITKGTTDISGSLVKDGEVFSTIGRLGPIEVSTGYLPELVIKGNRTIPEAGGGLCQVSTTLFRSVLNAGLPVTERDNHSYRVSYYEVNVGPGLDATIYDPSPDFKWKNDTGNAIYIQGFVTGNKMTFELYGTKDGRVAEVGKPVITQVIPVGAPVYSNTDTLYVGETKQLEKPHDGARTTVDYVVRKDGKETKQTFNSYYVAWPAQYLVGTKERPAA